MSEKLNAFAKKNNLLIRHESSVYVPTAVYVGLLSVGSELTKSDINKKLKSYLGELESENGLYIDIVKTR